MPSNPMQRKVRNSFLLGMIVMLLVALLIGALLFMVVVKPMLDDKKKEEGTTYAKVYQLKKGVKSGSTITASMVEPVTLPSESIPSDKIIAETRDKDGNPVPVSFSTKKAKIDLKEGTVLSESLLIEEEELENSTRLVEYNMLRLPIALDVEDYVDIRITFANGQDLIVVSKKEIKEIEGNTITIALTEPEILLMTSAIVEGYILPTSDFYVTKYAEAGNQEAAETTYVPTSEVLKLMDMDNNITDEAMENFNERFTNEIDVRSSINSQTGRYEDVDKIMNIETGIRRQIDDAKAAREQYLSGMSGY